MKFTHKSCRLRRKTYRSVLNVPVMYWNVLKLTCRHALKVKMEMCEVRIKRVIVLLRSVNSTRLSKTLRRVKCVPGDSKKFNKTLKLPNSTILRRIEKIIWNTESELNKRIKDVRVLLCYKVAMICIRLYYSVTNCVIWLHNTAKWKISSKE